MAVEVFTGIGGAQATALCLGLAKDGEAFREVFLQPCGQFGSAAAVFGDELAQSFFGFGEAGGVEDAADFAGDDGFLIGFENVGLGVLLEMELAALPRHAGEDGGAGGPEAGVGIADNQGGGCRCRVP